MAETTQAAESVAILSRGTGDIGESEIYGGDVEAGDASQGGWDAGGGESTLLSGC